MSPTGIPGDPIVSLEVFNGIGQVTLNRPEKRNALSLEMWKMLSASIQRCATDREISVVLLRGADLSVFSAGADIGEFQSVRSDSVANRAYSAAVKAVVFGIRNLAKPTIAMISGYCIGGGAEIAIACDMRFGSATAKLGITPAKLGFTYGVAETKMLSDLIGPSRAKDILFSARLLAADEAYRIGLLDRLYAESDLERETYGYIELLLRNAPNSIRGAKAIINGLAAGGMIDDPDLHQIVDDSLDSEHYREGVQAFLAKRRPNFPK